MVIEMNDKCLVSLEQLRAFLAGTEQVELGGCGNDEQRYGRIAQVLKRFGYAGLKRPDKRLVLRYLGRTTPPASE
jgi:hypothetical protein